MAHLAAIKGRVPFINFFDGFRTSHEIQKIAVWDYEDLADMVRHGRRERIPRACPEPRASRHARLPRERRHLLPAPRGRATTYYDALPAIVEEYMGKVNAKLGTNYQLFNYYGAPDADRVIVAMGSICDVAEEVVDYLNAQGEKVGLVKVRLYRPFASREAAWPRCPRPCRRSRCMDRTKEPGALGEPLYLDVVNALAHEGRADLTVVGGRYGLGVEGHPSRHRCSPSTRSWTKDAPAREFTVGIVDDVTNLSLPGGSEACPNTAAEGTIECKFWGLGGDGTVGANKNSIKIIGDHTDKYVQAYFQYDSKKTGGVTISHLRFGDEPIRSHLLCQQGRLRGLPQALLHRQGLPHGARREGRAARS